MPTFTIIIAVRTTVSAHAADELCFENCMGGSRTCTCTVLASKP